MSNRVITAEAILSYPHIWAPQQPPSGGDPKYGAAFLFTDQEDLKPLQKAAFGVVVEKFGAEKAKEMLKTGRFRLVGGPYHSIRTDVEAKGYPEEVVGFINANSNSQPGVVSIYPDEEGRPSVITDESKVYPGVIVKASVTPYWYDVEGNRGVTWGLNNIQVIRDGERLDGRVPAQDEFEADEAAVADLSDLTDEEGTLEDAVEEAAEGAEAGGLDLADLV